METQRYLTVTMDVGDVSDGSGAAFVKALARFEDKEEGRCFEVSGEGQTRGIRMRVSTVAENVLFKTIRTALQTYYSYDSEDVPVKITVKEISPGNMYP